MSTISSIPQKDILLARSACDLLGYCRKSAIRPQTRLLNSARSCRRDYSTRDGVAGENLLVWQSPQVREQLQQLVIDFLDSGHGADLWPATGIPSPREIPEYPIDKDRIIPLFCQIVWRQNNNQVKNDAYLARERLARLQGDPVEDESIPLSSTIPSSQEDSSHPSNYSSSPLVSDRKMTKYNIGNKPPTTDNETRDDNASIATVWNTLTPNDLALAQQQPDTQAGSSTVTVEKRLKPMPSDNVLEWVDTEDEEEIRRNQKELVMIIPCDPSFLRKLGLDIPKAKTANSDTHPLKQTLTQRSVTSGSSDCSVSSEQDLAKGRSALPTPSSNEETNWTMVTRSAGLHKSKIGSGTMTDNVTDDSAKGQSEPVRSREKKSPSPGFEHSRPGGDAPTHFLQDVQRNASPQVQQQINNGASKTANASSLVRSMDSMQTSQRSASPRSAWRTSLETEQNTSLSNASIASELDKDSGNSMSRPAKRARLISCDSTAIGDNADNVRNWADTLLEHQNVQSEIIHDVVQAKHKSLSPCSDNRTSAAQSLKHVLIEPLGIPPPTYQKAHAEDECKREAERCSNEMEVQRQKANVERRIPRIRFVIINIMGKSRITREWPIRSLGDRTNESVFVHVAKVVNRDIKSLLFRLHLNASLEISENVVDRGDEEGFTEMRRRYAEAVRKDMRQTKQREYLVEIVPEPEEEQAAPTSDDSDSDVEEVQFI